MKPLDVLGWGTIYLGAAGEAVDGALKINPRLSAKMPAFFDSALWHFLPLVLLVGGGIIVVARRAWLKRQQPTKQTQPQESKQLPSSEWSDLMEPVVGKTFISQEVEIDRKSFDRCVFINVTIVYRGTGNWQFSPSCRWEGYSITKSENRACIAFGLLLGMMQAHPGNTKSLIGEMDKNTGEFRLRYDVTRQGPKTDAQKQEDKSEKTGAP